MCNCNKNKKQNASVRKVYASTTGNCPNKRKLVTNIKTQAEELLNTTTDANTIMNLQNLIIDIEVTLSDKMLCPKHKYIEALKTTLNEYR